MITEQSHDIFATSVADAKDAEGARVYNVVGGDWDPVVDEAAALLEERIVVNMGPQHPSTHGVLRLILEFDGESVTEEGERPHLFSASARQTDQRPGEDQ